ncbi:MAG: redoxin domain-containing protein [Halobacteriota archaeon]
MLKRIFLLTTVALLLVAFAAAPVIALLPNGQQAPNFTLADLSGTTRSLTDYRGKVVVIDFFSVSCSACKSSATSDLAPLYNNYYRDDGRVQFLGIEVSGASAADTSSQFVKPTGITWPVLVGGTSNLLSSYGSTSVPTVYVLDSAGKVALATTSIDSSILKSTIDKLAGSGSGTGPAVSAKDANSLDVFVQGTDHALWYKHGDGTSSGSWKSLGGVLTSSPAVATMPGSNRIDVFARGTTGVLWQKTTTDGGTTWSNWYNLGGILPAGTGPAASWGAGRLDVFVQGTTRALYHRSDTTTWSGWENLGGILTSSPAAAAAPGSNRMDAFVRGTDGALWWKSYASSPASGWGAWSKIGGLLA